MKDKSPTELTAAARKPDGPLRKGWTTGACATAAAAAAYHALITGDAPNPVTIHLPGGKTPAFQLNSTTIGSDAVSVGIIKDAGDDPDITHGAEIMATVRSGPDGSGIQFFAGDGVGTVTLPGLPLSVGEPAINPKPREMITDNLRRIADHLQCVLDVEITLSVPGGEKLAEKTMNGRLGIIGGLSILGTTGIVVPYSCASWIHSIHRGIDVARAGGLKHIAAATGSTSEAAVKCLYDLPDMALIDMGDFAGGMLKYLREHPIERVTIAGGFGKLAKLAQGKMDLHSSRSRVDMDALASEALTLGASHQIADQIRDANTAMAVLEITLSNNIPLAHRVAAQAREAAFATLSGGVALNVTVFDRSGTLVANSDDPAP